jgi:hypothetical protein
MVQTYFLLFPSAPREIIFSANNSIDIIGFSCATVRAIYLAL